jgi:hypothetical protein
MEMEPPAAEIDQSSGRSDRRRRRRLLRKCRSSQPEDERQRQWPRTDADEGASHVSPDTGKCRAGRRGRPSPVVILRRPTASLSTSAGSATSSRCRTLPARRRVEPRALRSPRRSGDERKQTRARGDSASTSIPTLASRPSSSNLDQIGRAGRSSAMSSSISREASRTASSPRICASSGIDTTRRSLVARIPWPIREQFPPEHRVSAGPHPSSTHEEPSSPTTGVNLSTGGLLVRIQPEEPCFQQLS